MMRRTFQIVIVQRMRRQAIQIVIIQGMLREQPILVGGVNREGEKLLNFFLKHDYIQG